MKVNKHLLIIIPVLAALVLLGGCVIPYSREFRPGTPGHSPSPDASGNMVYPAAPPTIHLIDAATSKPIDDAKVVILIHREKYSGMCCASRSDGPREPLLYLEPISELPSLEYHQRGLIVLIPFLVGDTAAEYTSVTLFAHKSGYLPAHIDLDSCITSPKTTVTIPLRHCAAAQSEPALAAAVRSSMKDDEAHAYADSVNQRLQQLLRH